MDFEHLSQIAIKAALDAGKVIRNYMNDDISVEQKVGGENYATQVVTKVDRECESVILTHLNPTMVQYDIALLSEETEDDGGRFNKKYFWCVDPLDGTLAFINKHPGFSTSIALLSHNGTPLIGVVYDPATETLYHAIKGEGAFKNGEPLILRNKNEHLTYVTDTKLLHSPRSNEIESILNDFVQQNDLNGFKEISGGGSVLNAILVLEHGPACMFKFPKNEIGGGCIWDYAATACIYNELNLPATNFNGAQLDLNRNESSYMNHEGTFYSNLSPSN